MKIKFRSILHVAAGVVRPLFVLLGIKGKRADAAADVIEKVDKELPPEK